MACRLGTMRRVWLTRRYAIKFPRIRFATFRDEIREGTFLEGFRANQQERQRWLGSRDRRLCPVLWGDPLGFFLVMPLARPLTDAEFVELEWRYVNEGALAAPLRFYHDDFKRANYGVVDGEIVRFDYPAAPRRLESRMTRQAHSR